MLKALYQTRSSDVIRDIFALHFPGERFVLDLTHGTGRFWRGWDLQAAGITLMSNDLYHLASFNYDLLGDVPLISKGWSVVVLDPPFTAGGSAATAMTAYGASRGQAGGPQDITGDIWALYDAGLAHAARLACDGIIVKAQNVTHWGKHYRTVSHVEARLHSLGWYVDDDAYLFPARRPQPGVHRAKGAGATHPVVQRRFHEHPSVFLIAKPCKTEARLRDAAPMLNGG